MIDFKDINKRIADRHDVFYWQAERKITEEEAGRIFQNRHAGIENDELLKKANKSLGGDKLESIEYFDPSKANYGNVNSCRFGKLKSGKPVVIRCHPRGVKNGYFYVEALAGKLCIENGLPSYNTYAIHDSQNNNDCAFQVIDRLKGEPINAYLKNHPDKEDKLVVEMGKMMAKMHKLSVGKVEGFGSFDNNVAKKEGKLRGIYKIFYDSIVAGLEFDLKTLVNFKIITSEKAEAFRKLFNKDNPLIKCDKIVLVHNDFADWNLMTDGNKITGIIDFDECVAGDPIRDIACWSTFFDVTRINKFLEGYFKVAKKPEKFEERFQLLRLRYNIMKMTLRTRRYTYDPKEEFRFKIERGKIDLKNDAAYFGI